MLVGADIIDRMAEQGFPDPLVVAEGFTRGPETSLCLIIRIIREAPAETALAVLGNTLFHGNPDALRSSIFMVGLRIATDADGEFSEWAKIYFPNQVGNIGASIARAATLPMKPVRLDITIDMLDDEVTQVLMEEWKSAGLDSNDLVNSKDISLSFLGVASI